MCGIEDAVSIRKANVKKPTNDDGLQQSAFNIRDTIFGVGIRIEYSAKSQPDKWRWQRLFRRSDQLCQLCHNAFRYDTSPGIVCVCVFTQTFCEVGVLAHYVHKPLRLQSEFRIESQISIRLRKLYST